MRRKRIRPPADPRGIRVRPRTLNLLRECRRNLGLLSKGQAERLGLPDPGRATADDVCRAALENYARLLGRRCEKLGIVLQDEPDDDWPNLPPPQIGPLVD